MNRLAAIRSSGPVASLDVGGGYGYWAMTGLPDSSRYHITLLNLTAAALPPGAQGFFSVAGDATHLQFAEKEFDVVFSNSVIEHLPSRADRVLMAEEIRRVGVRYVVQTPSKWFPLEPHSHIPFFHFLPLALRALIIRQFTVKWFPARPTHAECRTVAESIRMLTYGEFRDLFPEAEIRKERLFGLTKSYIAEYGWTTHEGTPPG
jgi:ubiquinone/menaquinone biosynthesis C-methylase UbiE